MANKRVPRRRVDGETFRNYLKSRSMSIKEIAERTDISERTIRRGLSDKEFTATIVLELCHFFRENADTLFGPDDSRGWNENINYLCNKPMFGEPYDWR